METNHEKSNNYVSLITKNEKINIKEKIIESILNIIIQFFLYI
jgi:hypothetical protein